MCWSEGGPVCRSLTSAARCLVICGWLAVEGPGVLESRGAAFDKHTVYGDASTLDTPLLREDFGELLS